MATASVPRLWPRLSAPTTVRSDIRWRKASNAMAAPQVGIIMGSKSDWETMRHASETLTQFGVAHEKKIVSAHRTPQWMVEYASSAEARGLQVIIAGAGGAAHLPGMV